MNYIESCLNSCDSTYEAFSKREKIKLMQPWREMYSRKVFETTGKWVVDGCDYKSLGEGFCKSVKGDSAMRSYLELPSQSFLVVPEGDAAPAYLCSSTVKMPVFDDLPCGLQVFLFPEDYSWTMFFSYSCCGEFGPYFSRSEWQK